MFSLEMDAISRRMFRNLCKEDSGILAWERGISLGFHKLGKHTVQKTRDAIKNPPKTGRTYRLYGEVARLARKRWHRASAPGESPANLTGRLRRGTHYINHGNEMEFGYSEDTPYGAILERGSRRGKIKPRPNIQRRAEESSRDGESYFKESIDAEISRWMNRG